MKKLLGILVLGFLLSGNACAETFNEEKDKLPITPESIGEWDYTCKKEDFKKYVATIEGCIALQHLGKIDKSKKKLVVFLHGDRRDKSDYKIKPGTIIPAYAVVFNNKPRTKIPKSFFI